jgi:hypothetical protein
MQSTSPHIWWKTYASGHAETFVHLFTNPLEWRCLDQIRAPIQELCVAYLPD